MWPLVIEFADELIELIAEESISSKGGRCDESAGRFGKATIFGAEELAS